MKELSRFRKEAILHKVRNCANIMDVVLQIGDELPPAEDMRTFCNHLVFAERRFSPDAFEDMCADKGIQVAFTRNGYLPVMFEVPAHVRLMHAWFVATLIAEIRAWADDAEEAFFPSSDIEQEE